MHISTNLDNYPDFFGSAADDPDLVISDMPAINRDTPADYTYLAQYPDRISSDMAADIITFYATIMESRNNHVTGSKYGRNADILTTQDIRVSHVESGYGHSTKGHYDDSDMVVTLRYLTTESAMEYEAVIGVLNGHFDLWMD